MIWLFVLAFVLRLFLIPNTGFEADISFWKSWGLAVADFGIIKGLPMTNFNYPTPFGYFLFLMVKVYSFFADPHNFNEFWKNTNLWFLFVSKMPAIVADFGIAGVILYIGKHAKHLGFPVFGCHSREGGNRFWFFIQKADPRLREDDRINCLYPFLALVFLFNPVSLIDGAWWGQLDSLGVFLFLLALLFLLRRNALLAGMVYMIAMMTKLQNMIYGPIFFLFLWQTTGWQGLVRALFGATLTFFGLNIEFVLSRNFGRVIESITSNYDYFPWLSLNAFNPWWIISGAAGMKVSDKILILGLMNAKTMGLLLFSGAYLFAVLRQWTTRLQPLRVFLESFIIVNGAFFLFQTESHDRYAFPLVVLLLLLAPFYQKNLKIFSIFYLLFTLFYFYNLHYALIINYPQNGLPIPAIPALTIVISYLFTGAFLWLLLRLARKNLWTLIAPIALISLILLAKNMPLLTRTPVSLTTLTPFEWKQDFGGRMVNMPVNASLGFKNWSSLSVQYAFYRHGIGTHANGYQTFNINGLFKTFSFDYGVDTEAGSKGSVTFEVWGDDKKLFASEKMGRYDMPRHAEIDVTGVNVLKLVVTDAGDGITDDHADWLNPKLYP